MEHSAERYEKYRTLFWDRFEDHTNILVPQFLKDIFRFYNLDNAALSEMTGPVDCIIHQIESSVKSNIFYFVKENPKSFEFVRKYWGPLKLFQFDMGTKLIIEKLINYANQNPRFAEGIVQSSEIRNIK
ncbi:hypothetical protein ABEB36_011215 [Hypothenemus hampei]|uniref:Uncharacterized protein n=1 Tax=Hypothenemus hampei TaxID=57062 RepID=A0ABD1EEU7_HYPHA